MSDKKEKKESNKNDSSIEFLNSGEIIDRVRELLDVPNDVKLSHKFNISQNTIYSWRARNNADIGLLINLLNEFFPEKLENLDFNWLLTGSTFLERTIKNDTTDATIENLKSENEKLKNELQNSKNTILTLANLLSEKQ